MAATSPAPLFAGFAPATAADWRRVAEEALEGAPFERKLVTPTPEGIDLQPIYSRPDGAAPGPAEAWPGLPPYSRGADALGARETGWHLCQAPRSGRADETNAILRDGLNHGQNAVSLRLDAATRLGLGADLAPATEGTGPELALNTLHDVARALQGVDLAAVPLFVSAGVTALPVAAMIRAWLARQGQASVLHGAILAEPLTEWVRQGSLRVGLDRAYDDMAALAAWAGREGLQLRTVGVDAGCWSEAGGHAVQELAFGLATGTDYLRALVERGLTVDAAAPRFLFTFALGSNFFMEIAKLRAARVLWARVVQAAGGGAEAQRLVCHGRTSRWNKTVLDPHVNLLRVTTEAFAGVVGGCAGLEVGTFDECQGPGNEFSRRLARNLQIILAEECQAGRVIDPAGGSWYVETLTRELATRAWALFQDVARRGGMAAALREGHPQDVVEKTAAARLAAVETRRDGVIGTNLHPNLRETVPPVPPPAPPNPRHGANGAGGARSSLAPLASADASARPAAVQAALADGWSLDEILGPLGFGVAAAPVIRTLVPRRRAEPFEALRRRSDAHLKATGARPKVFLAGFGPRKQHAARAEFSAGFFAAGGFEVVAGKGFETPAAAAEAARQAQAPVVVACSTDETYPALVPPLARALKAADRPPLVILAGQPATPELQREWAAAGVDAFIHLRANCAQLLSSLQDRLGL